MKRKFAVKGIAGSTPLTNSKRINIDETPAPTKLLSASMRRQYTTPMPLLSSIGEENRPMTTRRKREIIPA
jgi:hypothetical protein